MKALLRSFIVPVSLSGAWGVMTYLLGDIFLSRVPIGYMFFYPIIMTGVVVAAAISGGSGVPYARAALTGFITGFIYLLVSPMFPTLASVLAGASLGWGLSEGRGRFGGLLGCAVSTLKGMIIFPIVIYSGELLGACIYIFLNSLFLGMVFWAAWLGLGVCLIRFPASGRRGISGNQRQVRGLGEFKDEAGEIIRDLGELGSGID
ncbi:MAG TPA: hypothetical protein VJV40_09360, partial [Thermodesulfobacteriota bacterium]|nr:hypothetical protein [Thermodesulfobacteriota bacterium]